MSKSVGWFQRSGHLQGVFWIVLSCCFSNLADMMTRWVSAGELPAIQITFFRLLGGALIILPLLFYQGREAFKIQSYWGQIVRVVVGFTALACWIAGVGKTSLPTITTISFICPILVLPLAYLFLGEGLGLRKIIPVLAGFVGVLIIAFYEGGGELQVGGITFHRGVLLLFVASVLFAFSDILNKKLVASEGLLSLVFYFYAGAALMALIPALMVWQPVGGSELLSLGILGASGVLVLYCILKAAKATEISSISPYKYLELLISIGTGYLFFGELIKLPTVVGALLIIPGAVYAAYAQIRSERKVVSEELSTAAQTSSAQPVLEEQG